MPARTHYSASHVRAAPEELWDLITRHDSTTHRLFAADPPGDMRLGSPVFVRDTHNKRSMVGQVVDSVRPRRMVMLFSPWERPQSLMQLTLCIEREGMGSKLTTLWEPYGSSPESEGVVLISLTAHTIAREIAGDPTPDELETIELGSARGSQVSA